MIDSAIDFVLFVIFGGIGCTLLLVIPLFIIGLVTYNNAEWWEHQTNTRDIISVERGSEISGHFVLGTGIINSYPVYYYYTGGDGNYQLTWSQAGQTSIEERDNESPKVRNYEKFTDNYLLRFLTSDIPFVLKDRWGTQWYRSVLVIPSNSIKREFHP